MEEMVKLFAGIGLDPKKARETTSNAKLSAILKDVIYKVRIDMRGHGTPQKKLVIAGGH